MDASISDSQTKTKRTRMISNLELNSRYWTIKVRVTHKSIDWAWVNSVEEGRLFSVDLIDESGEIRATAFNDMVDQFYNHFEVGKVYFISNGQTKKAHEIYRAVDNDLEILFTSSTKVVSCMDPDSSIIPTLKLKFLPLASIMKEPADFVGNFIGIVKDSGYAVPAFSESKRTTYTLRDITVVDPTLTDVTVTLWNGYANTFEGENNPVIAVRGALVKIVGSKKLLSLFPGASFHLNPDIPEAHKLREWFDKLNL